MQGQRTFSNENWNTHSLHIEFGHVLYRYNSIILGYKRRSEMHFKCNQISFLSTSKMKQKIISQFYSFVFVLLLVSGLISSYSFKKKHVRIVDNLNNETLNYHCQSAQDDLGIRTLHPNEQWEFSFHNAIYGTTEFYCSFWYNNFNASFDVYLANDHWLKNCGGDHCIWTVQYDGFYLYQIQKAINVKMHDWQQW